MPKLHRENKFFVEILTTAILLNFHYFSLYGIAQKSFVDKNVGKIENLPTLLSMNVRQKAIKLFKKNQGLLRTAEAIGLGIHPRTIYQLRDEGILEQLAKGVYRLVEVPDFSEPNLVLVSKKIPHGVICLISALAYYEITMQIPHFVYVAIPMVQDVYQHSKSHIFTNHYSFCKQE